LYFLGPYLNIKQATQTYLSETWKREQYLLKHPNDPPNQRAQSRIATSKIVSKHDRENVNIPNFWFTITGQVEALGLGEFVGQQHSGIDVSQERHRHRKLTNRMQQTLLESSLSWAIRMF